MKIILIAGAWYTPSVYEGVWGNLEKSLAAQYPGATFARESVYFWPSEVEKVKDFAISIVQKHDREDEQILLVGHSMGGVIACGIAPLFKKSKVVGIVTIFTPHTMGAFLPRWNFYERYFPHAQSDTIPVVSFGGLLDPTVWFLFTRHSNAVFHRLVLSDHHVVLGRSTALSRLIAKSVRSHISPAN
jgi:surfactin synthase thioesterase subunit